ncbi:hypothetical protein EYZ11_013037 [Aspergillus tanneri]|uniref:Uncharacterized protein n=1 Tax=Aspergillus tanneri TaxID=1220188 RepID=A0A4S3IYP9_9EURO|nr:hypothetical protein EYZ11_013037 [Aspergillus tanneri]
MNSIEAALEELKSSKPEDKVNYAKLKETKGSLTTSSIKINEFSITSS